MLDLIQFNTFSFERTFLEKINEQFRLENTPNLTHDILYDDFNKKILLNFLVKLVIQNLMDQI